MKSILIITHRHGFESDPIIDIFRKKSVPFFRFNQDDANAISLITHKIDSENQVTNLECDNNCISSDEISVGWFQQQPPFTGQPSNESQILQRQNLQASIIFLSDNFNWKWFNKMDNVYKSGNKILQLNVAKNIGFEIMPTLISNNPSHIRNFYNTHKNIIAKSLSVSWIIDKEQTFAAFTQKVEDSWLTHDEELSYTPVIYQKYCKRKCDYRVVVVGENCYAVSCKPNAQQMIDIRHSDKTGDNFTPCTFDDSLTKKLKSFMNSLGIDYCSADFMEDEKGNIFFLEANLCGAWWWVDQHYNGEIAQAIANELINRLNT